MRTLVWIFRLLIFFVLLIFAINNQHTATVNWMLGARWQAPMVLIVFAAFASGCLFGVLAMLPRWWRHRQRARATASPEETPAQPPGAPPSLPPLTHPPREVL